MRILEDRGGHTLPREVPRPRLRTVPEITLRQGIRQQTADLTAFLHHPKCYPVFRFSTAHYLAIRTPSFSWTMRSTFGGQDRYPSPFYAKY